MCECFFLLHCVLISCRLIHTSDTIESCSIDNSSHAEQNEWHIEQVTQNEIDRKSQIDGEWIESISLNAEWNNERVLQKHIIHLPAAVSNSQGAENLCISRIRWVKRTSFNINFTHSFENTHRTWTKNTIVYQTESYERLTKEKKSDVNKS